MVSKLGDVHEIKNKIAEKHVLNVGKEYNKGVDKIQAYRQEVSRIASLANKRVKRLEKNSLQDNPAYRSFMEGGGEKFSIRGKSYNEVQAEMARLRRFVSMESSTIRGTNNVLKKIADNTGIKYKNLKELKKQSKQFFELASKAEQYIRQTRDAASSIGYQRLWQVINEAQAEGEIDLKDGTQKIEDMVQIIDKSIQEYTKKRSVSSSLGTTFFKILPKGEE